MSLLFYLNKQSEHGLKYFSNFVFEFSKQVDQFILILCESESNYKELIRLLKDEKKSEIINVYGNMDNLSQPKNKVQSPVLFNYLFYIQPELFGDMGKAELLTSKLSNLFIDLIIKYEIRAAHFGINYGAFRSIGIVILQEVLNKYNIPLYWTFTTPIRGRYTIYNGIYYKNNRFQKAYNRLLTNGVGKNIGKEMDEYFLKYIEFKKNVHIPFMSTQRPRRREYNVKYLLKKSILFIQSKSHEILSKKEKIRDIRRPYILYIMTKGQNQWYLSYANPELVDFKTVIRNIWINIPLGYDLILKTHPMAPARKLTRKLSYFSLPPTCYICDETSNSYDLIKNAEIIINSGSTGGIEALMFKKHLIELGKHPKSINLENPPFTKVENIANLGKAIEECLAAEPPIDKIYAYFYTLIENSFPFNDEPYGLAFERDEDIYKQMAGRLVGQIKEDKLIS